MGMENRKPYRVAVYCRVANKSQLAIDCQQENLTQYAHAHGHYDLAYYTDNGESGLTLDRPGLRQMEAAIETGDIQAVLVKDFTRLGRDMWHVLRWRNTLTHKGVTVLSPQEPPETLTSEMLDSLCKAYASQRRKKRK